MTWRAYFILNLHLTSKRIFRFDPASSCSLNLLMMRLYRAHRRHVE